MKQINSNKLLMLLKNDVREVLLQCALLQQTNSYLVTQQPQAGKWSVAQVFEHLNIYARYYITAIEQQLHLNQTKPREYFNPGWLGNYFTNLMKPDADNRMKGKMKSPANAVPSNEPDAVAMLQEFIQHQHHLLNLLQLAEKADLNFNRIPVSITKLVKLKLGDTFRFFIAHEQRHFLQIKNTLQQLENKEQHVDAAVS